MPDKLPSLVYALGFSWRKRALLRQFLQPAKVIFVGRPEQIPDGEHAAVWASGPFGIHTDGLTAGERFSRLFVEDGFIRSVGLGADLVRPMSWVMDLRGIYYDMSKPSDLEHLLQTEHIDAATMQRAKALRHELTLTGLTKYNIGTTSWQKPDAARNKRIVLVAGQVEADAAIRLGTVGIKTNLDLLQAARKAEPDAWLIYKPHPDVIAGLRAAGKDENSALRLCDEIVTDVPMGKLLEAIDVIHVMTSLAGFEALLRGKKVVCHGLPFYAGWGLTEDALSTPRRSRLLELDELVAGVLLRYPTYVSRISGKVCTAEQALSELLAWRAKAPATLPFWRRLIRPLLKRD